MKTFIRAVEFWVPGDDRQPARIRRRPVRQRHALRRRSAADLCFGRGEGLPGQAWEAGHPIVLRQFEGSYFRRTAAAHAEGLTCGIALPIFAGDFLTSVLVIFCGDDEAHAGAIELWHNDPAESKDMTLVDGYYGTHRRGLRVHLAAHQPSAAGTGLPGMAWDSRAAGVPGRPGQGSALPARRQRRQGRHQPRLRACPAPACDGQHYVLAFLSALATPIVRRFEIW